jgi:serine protease Do
MARWRFAFAFLILGGLAGAFFTNSVLHGQPSTSPAPLYPKDLSSYRDVVKLVLPAVVSVQAKPKAVARQNRQAPRRRPSEGLTPEDFLRKFFEDQFDFQNPDDMQPRQSFGSGFVIDPSGIILTNYHVVGKAGDVKIQLQDGTEYTSKDIKGDPKNDLAIVRIHPQSPLRSLEFGDSDAMEIGDRVLAVGAPFGMAGSVTSGIISAKGRSLNRVRTVFEDYLQTDAAINPGNSGGPLVNLEGKVIGINTAIKTGTGGWQGVGLAITSNVAKNIAQQLIREGVVHRGYLGVSIADKESLDPEVAARLGVEKGALVSRVFEGSPAEKAGIRNEDVITTVAGKPVSDSRELQRIVGSLPLDKPVDIGISRNGQNLTVQATIKEQPENYGRTTARADGGESAEEAEGISVDKFGISVADVTPELAKRYRYKEDAKGVIITDVRPGGVADEAGLTKGLLIVRIDKKPVTSAAQVKELLQKTKPETGALVQFEAPGGGTAYKVLKPEAMEK